MKNYLLALFIGSVGLSFGQVFHLVDSTTTLIKSTDQSPAHWYIELYTDIAVDTNLRWKASFSGIPAAWQIDLDDQTNYTVDIQDGDSSDFILISGLSFPQKLIIGATLNNTIGVGSVYFDIYDPYNPIVIHQIEFHFIVTQGTASIVAVNNDLWVQQKGSDFSFNEVLIGEKLKIYSKEGKVIYSGIVDPTMDFSSLRATGQVFFVVESKSGLKSAKFLLR